MAPAGNVPAPQLVVARRILLPLLRGSSCATSYSRYTTTAVGQARGVIVAGQPFSPHLLQRLEREGSGLSRRQQARLLCQWLDWKGPSGRWREMSARKALAALQRSGYLHLPPPSAPPPRRVAPAPPMVATPQPPLHCSLTQLGPVTLELIPPGRSALGRA